MAAEYKMKQALHVMRMGHYSRIIAQEPGSLPVMSMMFLTQPPCTTLVNWACQITCCKPGKLTEEEWVIMRHLHMVPYYRSSPFRVIAMVI